MADVQDIRKLTPKQERFVNEYLIDLNATAAYKRAGYSGEGNVAESAASRLLSNVKVAAEIAKVQLKIARKHEVTQESLVAELEEAKALARQLGQPSAMVAATMGKAKITGQIIDRAETKVAVVDAESLAPAEAYASVFGSGKRAAA